MELTRLKARRRTAQRGHKLLKDKRDELMRRFLEQVRRARALRRETEQAMEGVYEALDRAAASLPPEFPEAALLCSRQTVSLQTEVRRYMGVAVPEFSFTVEGGAALPYGVAQTDAALDEALSRLAAALPALLELAGAEKTVHLMAQEIESTRRRVNALEYVMIPELQEMIRRITMKLEENERGNIVRLMKVKELVLTEALEQRRRHMQNSV